MYPRKLQSRMLGMGHQCPGWLNWADTERSEPREHTQIHGLRRAAICIPFPYYMITGTAQVTIQVRWVEAPSKRHHTLGSLLLTVSLASGGKSDGS